MKDLIRLLFGTSLLTSGFNLDEPAPVKDLIRLLVQQLMEFDGKKLKSTTMEGLGIEDEDEKKKLVERKAD